MTTTVGSPPVARPRTRTASDVVGRTSIESPLVARRLMVSVGLVGTNATSAVCDTATPGVLVLGRSVTRVSTGARAAGGRMREASQPRSGGDAANGQLSGDDRRRSGRLRHADHVGNLRAHRTR